MRSRLYIALPIGVLAAACSGATVEQPQAPPVNWQSLNAQPVVDAGSDIVTAKERALADAYVAALASPGLGPLGPQLDEDAHFASPCLDDAHGRSSVAHAHDLLFGAFDDRHVTTSRVWRTPSEQTVEWTMTGIQARDWMGVSAKHKPVIFRGLTLLWTRDDGSITDVHVYIDVAVVKAQLGVGPKELLALPPLAPPTGPAQVFEPTGSVEEKTEVGVVRSTLDALENSTEPEYIGAMADDVEVYTLARAQPARGKDDAKAYFKTMHKSIGQLDTTVDNAWGVAQFAIVEYSIAGEQRSPIGWVPVQRDKVIRLQIVDVAEVREGKIARIWRYDNPAQIAASSTP
jgi:ketosteroid isomerase-like protein